MALGPYEVQPAPPLTPPPSGLLKTATVIEHTDSDYRWANGVSFSPEVGIRVLGFDPCFANAPDVVLTVSDAATTNGSPTLTSATAAFTARDIGQIVEGNGIPGNRYGTPTTILSVTNATTVVLSANATATATGITITIPARTPISTRRQQRVWMPFVLEAWDSCSAFNYKQNDYEARAIRALLATETVGVEQEFWTPSIAPGNLGLAQTGNNANSQPTANLPALTVALNGGTAIGPRIALAALTQAAADNNLGTAMIHARPGLVNAWFGQDLVRQDSQGKLYTGTGIQVIGGAGYYGTGPAQQAATTVFAATPSEWAYVSDPVTIQRGPVETFGGLDTIHDTINNDYQRNSVVTRAQRVYLYEMNAIGIYGVNVNISLAS